MTAKILTALALGATLAALAAGPAAADTLLTLQGHRDAFQFQGQQQPAEDTAITLWMGKDRIRRDDGKTAAILQSGKNRLILINHPSKTYTVVSLPIDFDAILPPEAKKYADMMRMKATVTLTDETKKIGAWNARRYDVEITNAMGLAIRTSLWASRDLPIDIDRFKALSLALAGLQPGGTEAVEDLAKVDGFPVLQEISFDMAGQVVASSEKLLSVEERDAPAGTYDPPAGYTEQPFNAMAGSGPGQ